MRAGYSTISEFNDIIVVDTIHWIVHTFIKIQMNTLMFTTPSIRKNLMFQDSKFVPIKNLMF
jgi:hypothetical protein